MTLLGLADAYGLHPSDPLRLLPGLAPKTRQPQPTNQSTPEDESSLLENIASGTWDTALSGLGWLGETLGKGGSAVRGVASGLTGGPWGGGLLNLIPFSDTMGITRSDEKVGGEQLNKQWGIDTDEPWSNFGLGMVTDIVTDPLSFAGGLFGSGLSKAGRAAQKAGVWTKSTTLPGLGRVVSKQRGTINELLRPLVGGERVAAEAKLGKVFEKMGLDTAGQAALREQPLGGLMNLGFFGAPTFTVGTGAKAQRVGSWIDQTLKGVATSPVGVLGKSLFDWRSEGTATAAEQEARALRNNLAPRALSDAMEQIGKLRDNLGNLQKIGAETIGPEIEAAATRGSPMLPGISRQRGDIVRVAGNENPAYVRGVTDKLTHVYSEDPTTGRYVTQQVPHDQLELIHAAGTPKATEFATQYTNRLLDDVLRAVSEGVEMDTAFEKFIPAFVSGAKVPDRLATAMQATADRWKQVRDLWFTDVTAKGGSIQEMLEDWVLHNPRYGTKADVDKASEAMQHIFQMTHPSALAREPATANLPTYIVNEMALDKSLRGHPEKILEKYGDLLGGYHVPGGEITGDAAGHAEAISEYLKTKPVKAIYNRSNLADNIDYIRKMSLISKNLDAAHTMVAAHLGMDNLTAAGVFSQFGIKPEEGLAAFARAAGKAPQDLAGIVMPGNKAIGIKEFSSLMGVKPNEGIALMAKLGNVSFPEAANFAVHTGSEPLLKAFEKIGMDPKAALEHFAKLTGKSAEELAKATVPSDVVAALRGIIMPQTSPAYASALAKAYDKITGIFKTHFTMPWMSFHTRNFFNNVGQALMNGTVESIEDFPKVVKSWWRYRPGGSGWADKEMLQLAYNTNSRRFQAMTRGYEDMPMAMRAAAEGAEQIIPPNPLALGETLREAKAHVAATPSVIPGIEKVPLVGPLYKKARTAAEVVTGTGSKVFTGTENSSYMGIFDYLVREKGWDPAAAAAKASTTLFDYSALSPFERSYMKRLFPFWTFTRKMGGLMLDTLLDRPGGAMATAIKETGRLSSRDPMTPEYISQTLGIQMGAGPSGAERYLTVGGMGYEDDAAFFNQASQGLGGALRGGGLEALSRLNPMLKAPLEWITNQSFFQRGPSGGRELSDLDPTLGRLFKNVGETTGLAEPGGKPSRLPALAEEAIANSPISRYLTTARTMADPRKELWAKALGFMTPFKIADVTEAAHEAQMRNTADEMLKMVPGVRTFETVSVPEKDLAKLPPEQQKKVKELAAFKTMLVKKSKARAKQREAAGIAAY